MRISDWSSDVCSSDLKVAGVVHRKRERPPSPYILPAGDAPLWWTLPRGSKPRGIFFRKPAHGRRGGKQGLSLFSASKAELAPSKWGQSLFSSSRPSRPRACPARVDRLGRESCTERGCQSV